MVQYRVHLMSEIEAFQKRYDMADSRVGDLFDGDPHLVRRLKAGKSITLRRADKLIVWMKDYDRKHGLEPANV